MIQGRSPTGAKKIITSAALKKYRTQAELARAIGMNPGTLSIKLGKPETITVGELGEIARVAGLTKDEIAQIVSPGMQTEPQKRDPMDPKVLLCELICNLSDSVKNRTAHGDAAGAQTYSRAVALLTTVGRVIEDET
ncbi:hypothetical protein SAMN02745687_00946 [Lachnospiraceae bacterium NK3A20]|nr:hypothetical protein SAMN02745687_00946 [Lachnospiraceae bacterium NK3A20]